MNTTRRRVLRTTLLLLILLPLLLLGAAVAFLASPWGEDLLREQVVKRAQAATGLAIEIDDLETSVLTRLTVSGVRVRHREVADSVDLVRWDRLHVEYDLLPLLRKRIQIDTLAVDGLAGTVVKADSNRFNLPSFPPDSTAADSSTVDSLAADSSAGFPYDVHVGGARITLAHGEYRDVTQGLTASLDSLSLHLHGDPDRYDYRLLWRGASLDHQQRHVSFDDFLVGGYLLPDTVRVDTLRLGLPGASLNGRANAELTAGQDSTQAVSAGIDLAADLHTLERIAGDLLPDVARPLYGSLDFRVEVDGSVEQPSARVRLDSRRIRAGQYQVDKLSLAVRASQRSVALENVSFFSFGGSVEGHGRVQLDSTREHELSLTLNDIDLEQLQRTFADSLTLARADTAATSPFIEGSFRGNVSSSGPLLPQPDLFARANLIASVREPNDSTFASYQISGRYSDGAGSLVFRRGTSSVRTVIRQDSSGFAGRFTVDIPQVAQLTRPLGIEGLTGHLRGGGEFTDLTGNLAASATLSSNQLDYQGIGVDTLLADVRYDSSGLMLDRAWLRGAIAEIDSTAGPVGITGLAAKDVRYEADITGLMPDLNGQISLEGHELAWQDFAADAIDTRIQVRGQRINLAWLRVDKDYRRLNLSGSYVIDDIAGALDLWFTDRSPHDDDDDEDEREQRPRQTPGQDASDAPVQSASIPGDGRLRLEFNLPDSASDHIQVKGEGGRLPLGTVPRVHPSLLGIRGELGVVLQFDGTPRHPNGQLRLTLDSLSTTTIVLDSLQLASRFNDSTLVASLRARFAGSQPIRARLNLPLEPTATAVQPSGRKPLSAFLSARSIDLSVFNSLLPEGMGMDGQARVDYEAGGTIEKLSLNGSLRVDSARVDLGEDIEPLDSLSVVLRQQDSTLFIDRISTYTLNNWFTLNGRTQLLPGNAVDGNLSLLVNNQTAVSMTGQFAGGAYTADLQIPGFSVEPFETLVPGVVDMKATLTGQATVKGDTTATLPTFEGNLSGRDINLDFADMREYVDHGVFDIRFTSDGAVIDTLGFDFSKTGFASLSGSVDVYDDNIFYNLNAVGKNLSVRKKDEYSVKVDRLKLAFQSHDTDYHVLSGDIYLGDTRYEQDWRLDTVLRQISASPTTRQIADPDAFASQVHMNLRLREAESIVIDNNLADLKLNANLQASGTVTDPMLTGRVGVEQGVVNYLDQRFTVQEGVIDFVETREIDPYLNITATSKIIDFQDNERITYNVTLNITGQASQAKVDFSSEPYLDQTSIISLITLGSPESGAVAGQAGALAGRALSNYIGARVGSAVGLDQISLKGNLFSGSQTATLRATKELSDRASITYMTNVRTFQDNVIQVSYYLTDHWTLTGETNQEGEGSLDVKYRIRWREIRFK